MRRTKRRRRECTSSGNNCKKKALWMCRSEDVTNDEHAAFYSSLSHDWEYHPSLKHLNIEGQRVPRFVVGAASRTLLSFVRETSIARTSSCMCGAFTIRNIFL